MKKVFVTIISLLTILCCSIPVQAAPAGYWKYGELADEIYNDELELVAVVVFAEAGNQSFKGKCLVSDCILNRLNDPVRFGSTIANIIYQPGQFYPKNSKRLEWAYKNVTQECFDAVAHELEERTDSQILFYRTGYYHSFGTPAYKYGDHYFSY